MINRAVLTGRLTKNIELRSTVTGTSVAPFTLAVARSIVREGQQQADFINCVVWGRLAETMAKYLNKGSLIGVEGRIQTRHYDDDHGTKKYVTEVVVDNFTLLEKAQL